MSPSDSGVYLFGLFVQRPRGTRPGAAVRPRSPRQSLRPRSGWTWDLAHLPSPGPTRRGLRPSHSRGHLLAPHWHLGEPGSRPPRLSPWPLRGRLSFLTSTAVLFQSLAAVEADGE